MSERSIKLAKAREKQVRARYAKHYEEQDNFIIEAMTPNLVQIIIKPNEVAGLIGDLLKYTFDHCKKYGDDENL